MIEPILPLWLITFLFVLALGATILQFTRIRKRLSFTKSLAISLLRFIALSLLVSFTLNPFSTIRKEHKMSSSLAILIDTSGSMGLPGHGGSSRLEEVKALLLGGQRSLLNSLSEEFDTRIYTLTPPLNPVEVGELSGLKAEGSIADLTDTLEKLDKQNTAAILLSDGNLHWRGVRQTEVPLVVVPFGDPETYKDILIKEIKSPTLAFRGREVAIDATIKSYGYTGITLPVLLKDGNRLVKTKGLSLTKSPAEVAVSFSFIPEEIGEHPLSLSIQPQFGESLTANNTIHFPLKVVRDKIRILMVSGSPSMNYRFMRGALKDNPSVDLLSFIILRTPSDILNVPLQEQSLIPFPVETLFTKELGNFDLLIFDNFPPHLYLQPNHLEGVRAFVKEGGSFAVIGGPSFTAEGRYSGPPFDEILPVRLKKREDYRRGPPNAVKLSRAGSTHPLTDFAREDTFWQEIPSLDGINAVEAKNSATVLLESSDISQQPVLTVGNYGKGRVLVLATDYVWKWHTGMVAQGKGNWLYLQLMERMVRWLTKDPGLEFIQITLPEKRGEIGKETEFRIKVREDSFSPAPAGLTSMSVIDPDGLRMETEIKRGKQPGEYLSSFIPKKRGTYRLKIEAQGEQVEDSILIGTSTEKLDASPDHELLKTIATTTGGKILNTADEILKELRNGARKHDRRFIEEKRLPLWQNLYILASILFFLTAEWYFRRRWGLA